jgi:intracellular septation protein
MKFLFDLFPVILFFAAFKLADIYVATAVAIGATFLQIGILAALRRKIDNMLWASLAIIVVFGGATLLFHDETFIKWKPTVLYWLFSGALAASALLFDRNLLRAMLSAQLVLPDPVWARLNWGWVGFFALMGAINIFVAYRFTLDQWVNFKLFGATGLMLAFMVAQAFYLSRHLKDEDAPAPAAQDKDKP